MTEPAPKSRLPRTGTLVLIAVVVLIGGGALMVWWPYHQNQTAMAEVERLGGRAKTEIIRPAWIPKTVDIGHLDVFQRVTWVNLSVELIGTPIGDTNLKPLQGLSEIRDIDLTRSLVSDTGVGYLRESVNLEVLNLNSTQVGDTRLHER